MYYYDNGIQNETNMKKDMLRSPSKGKKRIDFVRIMDPNLTLK